MAKYTPPVKAGETYDVTIQNLGEKGDGIAKINKFAVIIPGTEIDKTYKIRIKKVLDKYAFAEIAE